MTIKYKPKTKKRDGKSETKHITLVNTDDIDFSIKVKDYKLL